MGKIKINLNAIKTDNSINNTTNESSNNITNDINMNKTLKSEKNISKGEINKEENIVIEEKTVVNKKIELNSIKKTALKLEKTKAPPEKIDLKLEKTKENLEKPRKPLFENYESVFKKDKINILGHIKKLKQIPKTNILLLTILIAITIAGIGFLFSTNPKIHNLNNYKTSILDTYNAISNKNIIGSGSITKKQIDKGGYIYNIKIKEILGKKIYIYNGNYYESENKLNIIIDKETTNRKKMKLVKILKNSFIK